MSARHSPTLADVFGSTLGAALSRINTCIPARVESYDDDTQRCSAQPLIKLAQLTEEGEREAKDLPVINEVPVMFPGSGGRRIKWDVLTGDVVLLLFSQASLDKWFEVGGKVDPLDDRRFSLDDAIALPGLMSNASDKAPTIDFTSGGEIHVGGSAALATKADLEALRDAFNAWVVAPTDGGAALKSQLTSLIAGPPAWPAGTSVVKGS